MARVASVGCIVCLAILGRSWVPATVHHCFDSSDRSDFLTIPLCYEHHQGANGFHRLGERTFNLRYKTSERRLLGLTLHQMELRRGP